MDIGQALDQFRWRDSTRKATGTVLSRAHPATPSVPGTVDGKGMHPKIPTPRRQCQWDLVYIPIGMNAGLELPHPGGNASGGFWNACPSRVLCPGPKWRVNGCALVSTVPVALRALSLFI